MVLEEEKKIDILYLVSQLVRHHHRHVLLVAARRLALLVQNGHLQVVFQLFLQPSGADSHRKTYIS